MKQLEPILKYHFWILLSLGLIMALSGWWMTTSQMKAAIDTRQKAIADALKKKDVGEVPGKDWEQKLKVVNAEQERLVSQSRDLLYARQKEKMVWPEVIREVAQKLKYREEFKDVIHRINYRDNYNKEVQRVYEIPRPQTLNDPNGVVVFPLSAMPHRVWRDHTPTSKQMWDSMEDLWLLEPILQAILEVNGGPEASKYDATILIIEQLKLVGGDRSKIGQTGEASGGGGGAAGGAAMPTGGMPAGFGGGMMADREGGGAVGGGGGGSLEFNLQEVFGDPGTATDDAGSSAPATSMPAGLAGAGGMENAGNRQSSGEEVGRRYIDDDQAQPYRTRGFKLTVIMDHRKIPDLYAQLTSSERSPWPIQIVRMHVGRLSDAGGVRTEMMAAGAGEAEEPGFAGLGGGVRSPALPGRAVRPPSGFGEQDEIFGDPTTKNRDKQSVDMMDNPFLARVTLAGMITLYKEPEKKDQPSPAGNPPETAPATSPTSEPVAEGAGEDTAADSEQTAEEEAAESPATQPATTAEEESMSEEETMSEDTSEGESSMSEEESGEAATDSPEEPSDEADEAAEEVPAAKKKPKSKKSID